MTSAIRSANMILMEAHMRERFHVVPTSRLFRDVAKLAIKRMEEEMRVGEGRVIYKDYIFVINRNTSTLSSNINSSPIRSRPADYNNIIVNPNDIQLGISDSKTQENSSEHRKELIGNRLVVDVQSTKIEKFFVKGHPFTQLSDHFGISTQLNIE